jgi:hypothetical protein
LAQLLADEISCLFKDWRMMLRDTMRLITDVQQNGTTLRKENIMRKVGGKQAIGLIKELLERKLIIDDKILTKFKDSKKVDSALQFSMKNNNKKQFFSEEGRLSELKKVQQIQGKFF